MISSICRKLFRRQPFAAIHAGLLRSLYKLDPNLTGIRPEIDWMIEKAIDELPLWSWHRLDRVYAGIRKSLLDQTLQGRPNWRKGPIYALMVARYAMDRLSSLQSLDGKRYFDLGCGAHNPFGTSAVMFLNGADEAVAFDQATLNENRVAVALYELLSHCALFESVACPDESTRERFRQRMRMFDAEALSAGQLEKGIKNVPLRYVSGDIHASLPVPEGYIDMMSSRDVLEHFLDLPQAIDRVAAIMARGGVACHHIDLVDHRIYKDLDPEDFIPAYRDALGVPHSQWNAWSFLAEPGNYSDGLCNRARPSDFRNNFELCGFQIVSEEREYESIPADMKNMLKPPFDKMSDDDINTVRVTYTMKKI